MPWSDFWINRQRIGFLYCLVGQKVWVFLWPLTEKLFMNKLFGLRVEKTLLAWWNWVFISQQMKCGNGSILMELIILTMTFLIEQPMKMVKLSISSSMKLLSCSLAEGLFSLELQKMRSKHFAHEILAVIVEEPLPLPSLDSLIQDLWQWEM